MNRYRFSTVVLVVSLAIAALTSALIPGRAAAAERGLRLHGSAGTDLAAPALGATVEMRVTGIVARTRVTQIFKNPTREWLEGIYVFPLPPGAAVDTLRMKVGERVLVGEVEEKGEARQTYETAKAQGTKATLIEQRNDAFTTSLANIGPGETVEVAIELQQIVSYAGGRFGLRFPMVLAPRYTPAGTPAAAVCPQPPVLPAGAPPINPFALHVDLAPGFPLARVASPSHRITAVKGTGKDGRERWAVDLAAGVAPADGDLVLEWTPAAGREPRAVYFSEEVNGEQYSLLMVLPPDDPTAASARLARETIFVIDTSGSMEGPKIEQARRALVLGLDRLQPGDWFNVIQFNSTTSALFPAPVPADPSHLEQARQYVNTLRADGGTEMLPALKIALSGGARGLVQQVIFATDGQVGNDAELLAYMSKNLGEHRMFTVAIGSSPNAAFLRKAAEIGRGTFTAIDSVERVAQGMGELIAELESPMLRQIDVRWADPAAEVWPPRVPDLYLGEPLVLTARQKSAGPVAVSGLRSDRAWSDQLPAAAPIKNAGIDKLWARQKIDSLLDTLTEGGDRAEVKRQVTELGLGHHLITPYTSLVAVDVEPSAPAGVQPATRVLPVNAPRDVPAMAPADVPEPQEGEAGEDVITVTSESPLLDQRRINPTSATVSQAELAKIPTARDPWAVQQATAGVVADRINVGGNENGQSASHVGLGSSPAYYDFDTFDASVTRQPACAANGAGPQWLASLGRRALFALPKGGGASPEWQGYLRCKAARQTQPWTLDGERACLAVYAADNAAAGNATPLAQRLDAAIRAGLLDGFIAVEVLAPRCPAYVALLPPAALADAERYLHDFVRTEKGAR